MTETKRNNKKATRCVIGDEMGIVISVGIVSLDNDERDAMHRVMLYMYRSSKEQCGKGENA